MGSAASAASAAADARSVGALGVAAGSMAAAAGASAATVSTHSPVVVHTMRDCRHFLTSRPGHSSSLTASWWVRETEHFIVARRLEWRVGSYV